MGIKLHQIGSVGVWAWVYMSDQLYIYTARVHHIEASSVTVFGALKPAPFMLQSQDGIRLVDTCFHAAFFRLTDIAASQFSQHV